MENLFGGLIEFQDNTELEQIILDKTYAFLIIKTALNYSIKMGILDMREIFLVYKSLNYIKNNCGGGIE